MNLKYYVLKGVVVFPESFTKKQVLWKLPGRLSTRMKQNPAGFTILELLVCILIIGIIARVAMPTAVSFRGEKIELAATDIAIALSFARDDAIRTGEERGIKINKTTGQVTVYRPNLATTPVTVDTVLYNPLTKKPYDFNIQDGVLTAGVSIENPENPFKYRNNAVRQEDIFFDVHGMPVFISGAQRYHLESGTVSLSSNSDTMSVALAPFTGRVIIQ